MILLPATKGWEDNVKKWRQITLSNSVNKHNQQSRQICYSPLFEDISSAHLPVTGCHQARTNLDSVKVIINHMYKGSNHEVEIELQPCYQTFINTSMQFHILLYLVRVL